MNPYTVIYVDTELVGSHMHSYTKAKHVEAESPAKAIEPFEGAAQFVFAGHLVSL